MINIFEELSWSQFKQLNEVRTLPLNEQVNQYNQYIYDLIQARQNWTAYQNKGLQRNLGFSKVKLVGQYLSPSGYGGGAGLLPGDDPSTQPGLQEASVLDDILWLTSRGFNAVWRMVEIPYTITSFSEITVGTIFTDLDPLAPGFAADTRMSGTTMNLITNSVIPQDEDINGLNGSTYFPWTSGTTEYIYTIQPIPTNPSPTAEVVNITPFVVPPYVPL